MVRTSLQTSLCIAAVCILCTFTGCRERAKKDLDVELPSTPVLSIESNWAVITSSHLRLRERPTVESTVITTLWRGYVLEVVSKQNRQMVVDDRQDFWYQVRYGGLQGWVFGAYLELYGTQEAAQKAGESRTQ